MTTPVLPLPEVPPMDAPAPDAPPAPPKRGRGRPKGSVDKAPRAPRPSAGTRRPPAASLEKRLGGSLTTVGVGVALISAKDGELIIAGVPKLAKSLVHLADQNPSVKANLERAMTAGAWSGVIAAVLPIGVGIAANHGMLPANIAKMLDAADEGDDEESSPVDS